MIQGDGRGRKPGALCVQEGMAGPSTAGLAKCANPFAQDDKFGVG